jgi:hypothetical protein
MSGLCPVYVRFKHSAGSFSHEWLLVIKKILVFSEVYKYSLQELLWQEICLKKRSSKDGKVTIIMKALPS